MARLGSMLQALDRERTPVHITDLARRMFEPMAAALPEPHGAGLRALLDPATLRRCARAARRVGAARYEATLRNTVAATIVHGGTAVNVIPSEIVVDLDGRALPGFGPDDMLAEVGAIVGDDVELEVLSASTPGRPSPTSRSSSRWPTCCASSTRTVSRCRCSCRR